MSNRKISEVITQLFAVPLSEVLTDAKHGEHTHFDLIIVTVKLENGEIGTGSTYTGGRGGRAITTLIEHDITELVIFRKELTVVGNWMNSNVFTTVLKRVAEGKLNLANMVSHNFKAEDATEAFQMVAEQPAGFLKTTITL